MPNQAINCQTHAQRGSAETPPIEPSPRPHTAASVPEKFPVPRPRRAPAPRRQSPCGPQRRRRHLPTPRRAPASLPSRVSASPRQQLPSSTSRKTREHRGSPGGTVVQPRGGRLKTPFLAARLRFRGLRAPRAAASSFGSRSLGSCLSQEDKSWGSQPVGRSSARRARCHSASRCRAADANRQDGKQGKK